MRKVDAATSAVIRGIPARRHRTHPVQPLEAVDGLVRAVVRRARQAHTARAVCGALATTLGTLACAVASGAPLGRPDTLGLAAATGLVVFVAWLRSQRVRVREVLRNVDARLHLGSLLLATYEGRRDTPESALVQLGAARLLHRVPVGTAMEAAVPHTLGFALLPLVALFAFVRAIDARDVRVAQLGADRGQYRAIEGNIRDILTDHGAAATPETRAGLEAAAQQVLTAGAAAPTSSTAHRAMEQAADKLEELAEAAPAGSDLAEALAAAAADVEVAALGLSDSSSSDAGPEADGVGEGADAGSTSTALDAGQEGPGSPAGMNGQGPGGDLGASDTAPAGVGPGATGDAAGRGEEGAVGSGAPAGSNNASTSDSSPPGTPQDAVSGAGSGVASGSPSSSPGAPSDESGLGATDWWPPRDAGIVDAWLQHVRR